MLLPFKLGLGGRVGSGRQFMSWITLTDAVRAFVHAFACEDLDGPVNTVAPDPVTNSVFTKALGRALRRPTILPLPAPFARLVLGEMAEELLLSSTRALPGRLLETGFVFEQPEIGEALEQLLGTARARPAHSG